MAAHRKYLEMFLEEGAEILSKLNQRILSLEASPKNSDALKSALRLAHTLKGGAKIVGLDNVSTAAHKMESTLKTAASAGTTFSSDSATELLATLDAVREALRLVSLGRIEEATAMDLSTLATSAAGAPNKENPEKPNQGERDEKLTKKAPKEIQKPLPSDSQPQGLDRLRVSVDKLDEIQNMVEDLTVQKVRVHDRMLRFNRLLTNLERASWEGAEEELTPDQRKIARQVIRLLSGRGFSSFFEDIYRLDQMVEEIQGRFFDLRMVPLAEVLDEFYRTVRDLAKTLGKQVSLEIDGKFTELDKRILEAIHAPLMHLVRNALDHGIEPPEERIAAGKPPKAKLTIRAYHQGGAVMLEVEDDGRGLDAANIKQKAVSRGLITEEEGKSLSEDQTYFLLCEPGFSTKDAVTQISGRGVGLDVVKERTQKLRGSLSIKSEKGRYTVFQLELPPSISSLSTVIVKAGNSQMAVPSLFIDQCLKVDAAELERRGGSWKHRDRILPVVRLAKVLGLEAGEPSKQTYLAAIHFANNHMMVQVDEFGEEREVILKPLGNHLREAPFVSGICALPDGELVPVLNVVDIHAKWSILETTCRFMAGPTSQPPSVLVVDDSEAIRHMEQQALEDLGYTVNQAANGLAAWKIIANRKFDLIVTDVEMPEMGGLELVRLIRASAHAADTPIVMVSSRGEDQYVKEGFSAGVNAYIPKDRFCKKELRAALKDLSLKRQTSPA